MKRKVLIAVGASLLAISQVIFTIIFYPLLLLEIKYQFQDHDLHQSLQISDNVLNKEFKIIIPKININSQVFPNIDPFNKNEYLKVLSKGVAEARGSAIPGEPGNIFLFAHSTDLPINVAQYNAIFYLVGKLTLNDEIYLLYQGKSYKYLVKDTKIISPSEVNYLKSQDSSETLTLMTCWPPGTTLKRLLIISSLAK